MAAALQHIKEADEIGICIGIRIDQRMAHARLRREMDHVRKTVIGKQCRGSAVPESTG